ncbi:hypothetical protein BGW42_000144 [Actinomortierella wolfii]|nr:hypothetical protein BGW42_000144 [Actinomortierella wolfii]
MESLGWRLCLKRLRSEWDIRLPKMLDFEPNTRHRIRSKKVPRISAANDSHMSTSTTLQAATLAHVGWNASMRRRLTRWNQSAKPWIWAPVSKEHDGNLTDEGDKNEKELERAAPQTTFSEGIDDATDESYPSRVRKALARTLSGGFQPTIVKTTSRKKVTFSEQVIIWGRRRSSVTTPPPPVSALSQVEPASTSDPASVVSTKAVPATPLVMSPIEMPSSSPDVQSSSNQERVPHPQGLEITTPLSNKMQHSHIDHLVREEAEFQRKSEDSNGSGTPSPTAPTMPELTVSEVSTTTPPTPAPTPTSAPTIPSACRKVVSALIPNRKHVSDGSDGQSSPQSQQNQAAPTDAQQLQSLRRSSSVPAKLSSLLHRNTQDSRQSTRGAANTSETSLPNSSSDEVPRPDSRASMASIQSSSSSPSSLQINSAPLPSPAKSVEFVVPPKPTARPESPTATTSRTGRSLSVSLGTRAKRSFSFVLPDHSSNNNKQQQQQQQTSANSTSNSTSVIVERQSSLKKNNFMYRIVHPQRYKRELEQQQQEQDRERLRFLVRLQHHQLMSESQNGFPACPDTMKWMLQIEDRTKQQQQQQQLLSQDLKATSPTDKDNSAKADGSSLSQRCKEGIKKLAKASSSSSSLSSTQSETEDPFVRIHCCRTPSSSELVTGLGVPGSMISTSVGTHFPTELQSKHSKESSASRQRPVSMDTTRTPSLDTPQTPSKGFNLFRKHSPQKQASDSSLSVAYSMGNTAAHNSNNSTNNTLPQRIHQLFHLGHEQTQSTSSLVNPKWTHVSRASTEPTSSTTSWTSNTGGAPQQGPQGVFVDDNPCRLTSAKPKVEDQTSFAAFGFPSPTPALTSGMNSNDSASSSSSLISSAPLPILKSHRSSSDLRQARRASADFISGSSGRIWRSHPAQRSAVAASAGSELEILKDEYVLDGRKMTRNGNDTDDSDGDNTVSRRSSVTFPLSPSPSPSSPIPQKESVGKVLIRKLTPRKKKVTQP